MSVYILGVRRRRSRGLQEGGGTRGASSRSPPPRPEINRIPSPPPPALRPLPTLLLLLFFTLSAGLGEWRVRCAPRSLRTVWRLATLGVTGGCPCSTQRYSGSAGCSGKPLSGRIKVVHPRRGAARTTVEEG